MGEADPLAADELDDSGVARLGQGSIGLRVDGSEQRRATAEPEPQWPAAP